jgi:hypothetical protein
MYPPYSPAQAYGMQNSAQMAEVAAMLGRYGVPTGNNRIPQYGAPPNLFTQMGDLVGQLGGQGAGDIFSAMGAFATNPAFASFLGPIPGMVQNMMGSMPVGFGADPAATMWARVQNQMGMGMAQMANLPDISRPEAVLSYNQQQQQFAAFTGQQNANMPSLYAFGTAGSQFAAGTAGGTAVQLANIGMLQQDSRFKNPFSLFGGLSGVDMADADLSKLAALGSSQTAGNAAEIQRMLSDSTIKEKAERAINAANNASQMSNIAPMAAQIAQQMGIPMDSPFVEMFMDMAGQRNNPQMLARSALGSLATLGRLGSAMDAGGEYYAERIATGIGQNVASADSAYSGLRRMGSIGAGSLMSSLASSRMLTTGGVDTLGNLSTEDVQKLQDAISTQLESFSKIAELGKRVGMSVGEITSTMNQMHGGRLASVLENAVDRNMAMLRQDSSFAGKDDSFLRAEAARRASAEIARPLETMIEIGRMGGLDQRMITGMAMAHSEMLGSAGMGAASGIMAASMVAQSNTTPVQASAMAIGASQRAMASKSGQLMGTLQMMVSSGLLEEGSTEVNSLREGILNGSVDASTLAGKGATPSMLGAGAQQRGLKDLSAENSSALVRSYIENESGLKDKFTQVLKGDVSQFAASLGAAGTKAFMDAGIDLSKINAAGLMSRLDSLTDSEAADLMKSVPKELRSSVAEARLFIRTNGSLAPGGEEGLKGLLALGDNTRTSPEAVARARVGVNERIRSAVGATSEDFAARMDKLAKEKPDFGVTDFLGVLGQGSVETLGKALPGIRSSIEEEMKNTNDPAEKQRLQEQLDQFQDVEMAYGKQKTEMGQRQAKAAFDKTPLGQFMSQSQPWQEAMKTREMSTVADRPKSDKAEADAAALTGLKEAIAPLLKAAEDILKALNGFVGNQKTGT